MKAYRVLGLRMIKTGQEWKITGPRVMPWVGNGNKGTVMSQALMGWEEAGIVELIKGEGWRYVNKNINGETSA